MWWRRCEDALRVVGIGGGCGMTVTDDRSLAVPDDRVNRDLRPEQPVMGWDAIDRTIFSAEDGAGNHVPLVSSDTLRRVHRMIWCAMGAWFYMPVGRAKRRRVFAWPSKCREWLTLRASGLV